LRRGLVYQVLLCTQDAIPGGERVVSFGQILRERSGRRQGYERQRA
jgi:hypothetical protein